MNDFAREVMNLSDDWWTRPDIALDFARLYQRHTLGLLLAGQRGNGYIHEMLSGFSLFHRNQVLWVTAGHVIQHLNQVLHEPSNQITMMVWSDYAGFPQAGFFPVGHRDFKRYFVCNDDTDIGFGILEGLDAQNITQTPGGNLLAVPLADKVSQIVPEGYHLVGYPGEYGELTESFDEETNKNHIATDNKLVTIPVQKVEYSLELGANNNFSRNPTVFYGQIVQFSGNLLKQPSSIKGMSGGPIFAVSRSSEYGFQYFLAAVQSSWLPNTRAIKAEPISRVVEYIDKILSDEK